LCREQITNDVSFPQLVKTSTHNHVEKVAVAEGSAKNTVVGYTFAVRPFAVLVSSAANVQVQHASTSTSGRTAKWSLMYLYVSTW
jgi:hypothetical protein